MSAAARILGCGQESVLGQPIRSLVAGTRLPIVFQTGRADSSGKMTVNGRQVITTRVPVCNGGELVAAAAIFQEMEELEAISQELDVVRRMNREYDAIFESSWDGIVVADGQGRLLRVNRAYERITGIRPCDIIGREMQEMVNSGMVDHSSTLEVLSQRKPITIVQTVKTGRVMLVSGSPIFDEQTGEMPKPAATGTRRPSCGANGWQTQRWSHAAPRCAGRWIWPCAWPPRWSISSSPTGGPGMCGSSRI